MFKDDKRGQTHYCEACEWKYEGFRTMAKPKHTCGRKDVIGHIGGEAGVSRKNKEALPFWEEELVLFIWGMDFSDPSAQSIAKKIMPFIRQVIKTEREKAVKDYEYILKQKIGLLRQWLNEDRIDSLRKMVSNEQIEKWLIN